MDITKDPISLFDSWNHSNSVIEDFRNFFKEPIELPKISVQRRKSDFMAKKESRTIQPTLDERKKLKKVLKSSKKLVKYLFSHQHLCRYASLSFPHDYFTDKSLSFSKRFVFSIISQSFDVLSDTFMNVKNSTDMCLSKNKIALIDNTMNKKIKKHSLVINFSNRIRGVPLVIDDLACPSAFAASQNEVFIGHVGGLVRVISLDRTGKQITKFNLWKKVGSFPYSLCFALDHLFMITENKAYKIDVTTNTVSEIMDKPDQLVPPVVTDGKYFYSVRFFVHKGKLNIFSFNNEKFCLENRMILNGTILKRCLDIGTPFVTDGVRMSFASIAERNTFFIEFSLETGKVINEYDSGCSTIINAWCMRPFSNEFVCFTNSDISVFNESFSTPKWIVGSFIQDEPNNSIISVIYSLLCHNVPLYEYTNNDEIERLLKYFIDNEMINGVVICCLLLIQNRKKGGIDKSIEMIVDEYKKTSNIQLKHFFVYVFLECFHFLEKKKIYHSPNILSNFIEVSQSFEIIWNFIELIDFKTLCLSKYATDKLMTYVCHYIRPYPIESSTIIINCFKNYLPLLNTIEHFDDCVIPFNAIAHAIIQKIRSYAPSYNDPTELIESPLFTIWKYFLKLFKNTKVINPQWSRLSYLISGIVDHILFKIPPQNEKNKELIKMFYRTLYVFIGIILSFPCKRKDNIYNTIDDFKREFPLSLPGSPKELDDCIFRLISNSYDITTKKEFKESFFFLKKKLLFEVHDWKNAIEPILDVKNVSYVGIVRYIYTRNRSFLFGGTGNSLIALFIKSFNADKFKLSDEQEVIFSIYSDEFQKREKELLDIDHNSMQAFLDSFTFPAFMPPAVLKNYTINISKDIVIKSIESRMIYAKILDSITVLFPLFCNPKEMISFVEQLFSDETVLFTQTTEDKIFKILFLSLLCISNGAYANIKSSKVMIACLFSSASIKNMSIIMHNMYALDVNKYTNLDYFYDFILRSISKFLISSTKPFYKQTDSDCLQSVFITLQFLKQLANDPKSMLNSFLLQTPNEEYIPAIFAIFNNSFEVIRSQVNISFVYENKKEISGKVIVFEEGIIDVEISVGTDELFNINQCSNIICEPIVKIDFDKMDKSMTSFIFSLLMKEQQNEVYQVLKLACLHDFISVSANTSLFSPLYFKRFESTDWNILCKPNDYALEFFNTLSVERMNYPEFSFVSLKDSMIESSSNNGIIASFGSKRSFVTSPLHSESNFTLILNYESQKNHEHGMQISIFSYSKSFNIVMRSEPIQIRNRSKVALKIDYNASMRKCSISEHDKVFDEIVLSPASTMIYFTIDINVECLVRYSLTHDDQCTEARENPKDDLYKMHIARSNCVIPLSDSSFYYKIELISIAKKLVSCFSQMIYLSFVAGNGAKLIPKASLHLLYSHKSLINLIKSPFTEKQRIMFDITKSTNITTTELIHHIRQSSRDFFSYGFAYYNYSALVLPKNNTITVRDCTIISGEDLFAIDNEMMEITTQKTTAIIPNHPSDGTFLRCLVAFICYIILMARNEDYDYSLCLEVINEYEGLIPAIKPKLNDLRNLIALIAPEIPKPHEFPAFNESSFLVHMSLVNKYPDIFLCSYIINKLCKPRETKQKNPFLNSKKRIFIEVLEGTIIINGEKKLLKGQYDICDAGFSVEYEEGALVKACELPDLQKIQKELMRWDIRNSFFFLSGFPTAESLTYESFMMHPLSTVYSYETAQLVNTITRRIPLDLLFKEGIGEVEKKIFEIDECIKENTQQLLFSHSIINKEDDESIKWMKSFINQAPISVILQLVSYLFGDRLLTEHRDDLFYVWVTDELHNDTYVVRDERILVIGHFDSKELFIRTLLKQIQDFMETLEIE